MTTGGLLAVGCGSVIADSGCTLKVTSVRFPAARTARIQAMVQHPGRTPAVRPTIDREVDEQPATLWRLVLLDDDDHSYEYVIEMLGRLFGYGVEKSFALARIVDTDGRVTLMTAEREVCELKQQQVHAYGADPRIPRSKGSMTAIVEPLDEATG